MLEAQLKAVDTVIFNNTQYYLDNIKEHFINHLRCKWTKCYYFKTTAGLDNNKIMLNIIQKTQI